MYKTFKVHVLQYFVVKWVDLRKKKMIVLQELNKLDWKLKVTKANGLVDNVQWKTWKILHIVSTAMWNVKLVRLPIAYFAKHLTNKRKLKQAYEFQEKICEVL
jgi:hypothetical protein